MRPSTPGSISTNAPKSARRVMVPVMRWPATRCSGAFSKGSACSCLRPREIFFVSGSLLRMRTWSSWPTVSTIARVGGDEFAVIQIGPERVEDVAVLAQRISDVLCMPYEVDGHQVIVGVSIGIALVPTDGSDPDTLLKNAD